MKDLGLIQEVKSRSVDRRCQIVANEKSETQKVLYESLWGALNASNRPLGGGNH